MSSEFPGFERLEGGASIRQELIFKEDQEQAVADLLEEMSRGVVRASWLADRTGWLIAKWGDPPSDATYAARKLASDLWEQIDRGHDVCFTTKEVLLGEERSPFHIGLAAIRPHGVLLAALGVDDPIDPFIESVRSWRPRLEPIFAAALRTIPVHSRQMRVDPPPERA